jgi:hypothetical protein
MDERTIQRHEEAPFVHRDRISEVYGYLRKNVVCIIGNVAYDVRNVLEIDGERVIGFEKDASGYDLLNLLIRDAKGSPVLVMENNIWTAYSSELHDLVCTTRGKELRITAKDGSTNLEMKFHDFPLGEFREHVIKGMQAAALPDWLDDKIKARLRQSMKDASPLDEFMRTIGEPATIPTWIIKGRLSWGTSTLEIRDFEMEDERHNVFGMNFVVSCRAAFSLNRDSRAVGVA